MNANFGSSKEVIKNLFYERIAEITFSSVIKNVSSQN